VFGDRDDLIGAPRVRCREHRVVPADLSRRAFRVVEEVQVVDRHQLCSRSRHEQRMTRLDDVEPTAGEEIDRWPAQSVPGEVEGTDRPGAVDHACPGDHIGRKPVLPR
jgi:hypothetical protein